MELDKNIKENVNKTAAVTYEGVIVAVLGNQKYDVRLKTGSYLRKIIGGSGLSKGNSVILSKQGSVWNILQRTYDSNGDTKAVAV